MGSQTPNTIRQGRFTLRLKVGSLDTILGAIMKIGIILLFGVIAGLNATSTFAQQLMNFGVSYYDAVYKTEKPQCNNTMSAEARFNTARMLWSQNLIAHNRENLVICLVDAAEKGYGPAQTLLGQTYIHTRYSSQAYAIPPLKEDPEAALYWFQKASDNGDAAGAFQLAQLYEMGVGTAQDDAKAGQFYSRAVSLGYSAAKAPLKAIETREVREKSFMGSHLAKANSGNMLSMRQIGEAYLSGNPLKTNFEQAAVWLLKAANAGDHTAQLDMGQLYEKGWGVKRDNNQAADWYLKAYEGKIVSASYELAHLYYAAKNLSQDRKSRIADLGAQGKLKGEFGLRMGPGSHPEPSQPVKPEDSTKPDAAGLLLRADKGEKDAQYKLGVIYMGGYGLEADPQKSAFWFEKAAAQGLPYAYVNLGDILYNGTGVTQDKAKALEWYEMAAEKDDPIGMRNAAIMYKTGQGTPVNLLKAYTLALRMQMSHLSEADPLISELDSKLGFEDKALALADASQMLLAWYTN